MVSNCLPVYIWILVFSKVYMCIICTKCWQNRSLSRVNLQLLIRLSWNVHLVKGQVQIFCDVYCHCLLCSVCVTRMSLKVCTVMSYLLLLNANPWSWIGCSDFKLQLDQIPQYFILLYRYIQCIDYWMQLEPLFPRVQSSNLKQFD